MRDGFSLLMCAPDERRMVKALLEGLGRSKSFIIVHLTAHATVPAEKDIPELPVELSMLDKLKARVQLARKIETSHHKVKKANHDRNWMKEAAEAMEIELDSDYLRFVHRHRAS